MNILKKVVNNLRVHNKISAHEMIEVIDKEGIAFYQEKYGFIRILTGYDIERMMFKYVQAPLSYSFKKWDTILHLYTHKMLTEHEKSFDELEYFSFKVEPFNKFEKWILVNLMKLKP